jgi:hypothetical protein
MERKHLEPREKLTSYKQHYIVIEQLIILEHVLFNLILQGTHNSCCPSQLMKKEN